jgi:hypothetical protein
MMHSASTLCQMKQVCANVYASHNAHMRVYTYPIMRMYTRMRVYMHLIMRVYTERVMYDV